MRKLIFFALNFCLVLSVFSQQFIRKDSLRGNLTELRTCYDVNFYDLFVMVDEQEKSLEKSYNIIHFTVVSDFDKMQIDLAFNLEIIGIEFKGVKLEYTREFDAVYIQLPSALKKGDKANIKILYRGYPREA